MDQNISHSKKWEGKVSKKLDKATAEQIWPLFEDFFGIHKWFPGVVECYGVQGANGELGCIRYATGWVVSPQESTTLDWAKEKLVAIDRVQMMFSYAVIESNIGFENYVATFKVVPAGDEGDGCLVEWSFTVDPVAGWKLEDLMSKYETWLPALLKKMEADACILGS